MQYWKLESDDPLYKDKFGDVNIRRFKVVTDQQEQIGKVLDALVDEQQLISLYVEAGSWLSSEQIVVPLGEYQLQPRQRTLCLLSSAVASSPSQGNGRPSVSGSNGYAPQVLPDANSSVSAESVAESAPAHRTLNRSIDYRSAERENSLVGNRRSPMPPVQSSGSPLRTAANSVADATGDSMDDAKTIRLLEERLLVEQHRRRIGEVVVHKVVDTHMIQVPVRRERLVVEQVSPERKQLAVVDLGQIHGQMSGQLPDQMSEAIHTLEPGVQYQANPAQVDTNPSAAQVNTGQVGIAQNGGLTQAATLTSTQQFLARLAQRPQLAKAKLRLVFDDPELQTYYQRWLNQG